MDHRISRELFEKKCRNRATAMPTLREYLKRLEDLEKQLDEQANATPPDGESTTTTEPNALIDTSRRSKRPGTSTTARFNLDSSRNWKPAMEQFRAAVQDNLDKFGLATAAAVGTGLRLVGGGKPMVMGE